MPGQGLRMPYLWLAFYPIIFYFLVSFCAGDFTSEAMSKKLEIVLSPEWKLRVEWIAILNIAVWHWYRTLACFRAYSLPNGSGGFYKVSKWDPDHWTLAVSCLFSPVQVTCLLLPETIRNAEGQIRPSIFMLMIACGHGYLCLMIAHMFLRREWVNLRINNSVYAKEVDYRTTEFNKRRVAEREVVEGLKHKSKQYLRRQSPGYGRQSSHPREDDY